MGSVNCLLYSLVQGLALEALPVSIHTYTCEPRMLFFVSLEVISRPLADMLEPPAE